MHDPPDWFTLTVCICTRNRPDDLATALKSIAKSSVPVHQIVVSDDSTDDRTRSLIQEEYPEVLFCEGPRRGLSANRNTALRHVDGRFVLFIDDDVELSASFVATMRDAYRRLDDKHRQKTIIGGTELNHGHLVTPNDQSFLGYQSRPYGPEGPYKTVVINAAVFPSNTFESVLFNENLRYGYDEVDFTTRAVRAGFRILFLREATNIHTPSPINRDYYASFTEASRLYVTFRKYLVTNGDIPRAGLFAVVAPVHALRDVIRKRDRKPLQSWFTTMRLVLQYLRTRPMDRPHLS